jgi:hypothetical protein
MKELIDFISLIDPKAATKARKVVRITKAVDKKLTELSKPKK